MENASSVEPHSSSLDPAAPASNESNGISVGGSGSKWEQALQRLKKEDQEQFERIKNSSDKHSEVLDTVLVAANERKEECLRKKWKVATINGRKIYIRDILEKLSVWVKKLIAISDIAIQYDPVHAALPWAAVRLIMQTGINDLEVFSHVIISLENIASIVAQCHIIEAVYLGGRELNPPELSAQVAESVISLYAAILQYLADIIEYFALGAEKRILRSIRQSQEDFQAKYSPITHALENFGRLTGIAQAANLRHGLNLIRNIEKQLRDKNIQDEKERGWLKSSIEQLQQPIDRIDTGLQEIRSGLERHKRDEILKAISTIPYGTHHKTSRNGILKGSGEWFLQRLEFYEWRASSYSSVIWLHGIPGSGKTKLTSLVIDRLLGHEHMAYFYCMRNPAEPQRAQCNRILGSLVRQLATAGFGQPILAPAVKHYEDAIKRGETDEDQAWTTEECVEVLLQLFDKYPAVALVLDALDEVNQDSRQELLDALSQLIQQSTTLLRIFISSRDNYDIALHLAGTPNIYIRADDNAEDISSFIDKKLTEARLLHGNLSSSLRAIIVDTLRSGAKGMFRWVDLQIQSLRSLKVAADVKTRLGKLPATLEASYWEIFQQIMDSGDSAVKLAAFAFQWLLYAKEPMSLNGVAALASVALDMDADSNFSGTDVLDVCSNLAIEQEHLFQFAHLSVREFFEGLRGRQIDTFLREESHAILAQACLRYLNQVLVPDEGAWLRKHSDMRYYSWKLKDESEDSEEVAENKVPLLGKYVVFYMLDHVNTAGILRLKPPLSDLMKAFLLQCTKWPCIVAPAFRVWYNLYRLEEPFPLNSPIDTCPLWPAITFGWPELVEYIYQNPYDGIDRAWPVELQNLESKKTATYVLKPFWYAVVIDRIDLANSIIKFTTDKSRSLSLNDGFKELLPFAILYRLWDALKVLIRQYPGGHRVAAGEFELAAFYGREAMRLILELSFPSHEWADPKSFINACGNGRVETVKLLIESTATVARAFRFLYLAVSAGHTEVVRLLLERRIGSSGISTALLMAFSNGDKEMMDLLIQHRADETRPLGAATTYGLVEEALRLIALEYEREDGVSERRERTILHIAAEKGLVAVVEALLVCQVDVNVLDECGTTPLYRAASSGHYACVRILIDAGADVSAGTVGKTALAWAEGLDHNAITNLIRQRAVNSSAPPLPIR
ncbi:hypothetical protein F5Y10DRAFT_292341 [Nemania abortiva]|nr:hypothetical protein F5Y10DRAFT_292341 [Nemania abortiva]